MEATKSRRSFHSLLSCMVLTDNTVLTTHVRRTISDHSKLFYRLAGIFRASRLATNSLKPESHHGFILDHWANWRLSPHYPPVCAYNLFLCLPYMNAWSTAVFISSNICSWVPCGCQLSAKASVAPGVKCSALSSASALQSCLLAVSIDHLYGRQGCYNLTKPRSLGIQQKSASSLFTASYRIASQLIPFLRLKKLLFLLSSSL